RIKPFEGIIREALLVLHAIARHRSYPENLRNFRMMILNRQLSVDGKRDKGYRGPDRIRTGFDHRGAKAESTVRSAGSIPTEIDVTDVHGPRTQREVRSPPV